MSEHPIPWQPIETLGEEDVLMYFPLEDYGHLPNPATMYQIARRQSLRVLQPTAWAPLHTPHEKGVKDRCLPWQPIEGFGHREQWGLFFIPRDGGMPESITVRPLGDIIIYRRVTHFVRLHRPGAAS